MSKEEYELQHFDFSCKQLSMERRFVVKKFVSAAIETVAQKLSSNNNTQSLLLEKVPEVAQEILAGFEMHLKDAEALDENYFAIPKHVLLPVDFEQMKQYNKADEQQLSDELTKLKQNFLENSLMIEVLRMENEQYDKIETYVEDELKLHENIMECFHGNDLKYWQELVNEVEAFKLEN